MAIEAEPEQAVEGNDHMCELALLFSAYDEHYTYVSLGVNLLQGYIHNIPALIFHFGFPRFSVLGEVWSNACQNKVLFCASTLFIVENRGRGNVKKIPWGEMWNISPGGK